MGAYTEVKKESGKKLFEVQLTGIVTLYKNM
jgi:hypothetical protein